MKHLDPCIAVPGGAGFIGSHLCDRLLELGHQVIVIDDFSTGDPLHLERFQSHPRFTLIQSDLVQSLPAQIENASRIFNLACPASPAYYQREPIQTTLTSAIGMWRLLEVASRTGARVLQTSTSEVYGNPLVHPQVESYWGHVNSFGPRACYDEGKRCAEALCFSYQQERHLDIRIGRIFNTYGPRLGPGDGRVVSNFIAQALRGEPLTVYGDGMQTRSFCYVSDTVRALMLLMESGYTAPVNIGNPREHTVLQLAEMVLSLTNSTSRIEWRPLPEDDPCRRRPDIALATLELGWEPCVTLEDGLRETIAHFRHEMEIGTRMTVLSGSSD